MDDFNPAWLSMDLSAPLLGAPALDPPLGSSSAPPALTGFDPLSTPATTAAAAGAVAGAGTTDTGTSAAAVAPRPSLKLDETRLLQPDALPYLRSVCKNMHFSKARGAEVANLDKLIHFYKVWAHRVFPRYPYDRFVERTMRVCRTKRVKAQLNQWLREDLETKGTYDVDPDAAMLLDDQNEHQDQDQDQERHPEAAPDRRDHEEAHVAPNLGASHRQDNDQPDRMDVDPTCDALAAAPAVATHSPDRALSAKQRALDRLAQLKQSRFRRPMSPASLPTVTPLAPLPLAPLGPSPPTAAALAPASTARRVIADDSDDDDDDLIITPTPTSSARSTHSNAIQDDILHKDAHLGVFADMADDDDHAHVELATRPDSTQDAAVHKRAQDLGLSAADLDGVDMDALFALDDEQW